MLKSLHIGVSTIGQAVIKACLSRNTAIPAGAVDSNPTMAGQRLVDIVPGVPEDALIYGSLDEALAAAEWDVAALCTASHLPDIRTDLEKLIDSGVNVVATSEELAYPKLQSPQIYAELDAASKAAGVTVVGTGVNPGFVLDLLPAIMLRPCVEVRSIEATRIVNTLRRRKQLQLKLGAGLEVSEFEELKAHGKIGHVGLLESTGLIARALGHDFDIAKIQHTLRPVIADAEISSEYVTVHPGQVLGAEESIVYSTEDGKTIGLNLRMRLGEPEEYDEIRIDGIPPLLVRIEGGIHGDSATAGCTANIMQQTVKAVPGLLTVLDIPVA